MSCCERLVGPQAQGVFQFFNKPNQKGHKSSQAEVSKAEKQEHADTNIDEDWGNRQVW